MRSPGWKHFSDDNEILRAQPATGFIFERELYRIKYEWASIISVLFFLRKMQWTLERFRAKRGGLILARLAL